MVADTIFKTNSRLRFWYKVAPVTVRIKYLNTLKCPEGNFRRISLPFSADLSTSSLIFADREKEKVILTDWLSRQGV